VLQETHFIC